MNAVLLFTMNCNAKLCHLADSMVCFDAAGFRIAPGHQLFPVNFFEMAAQMIACVALLAGQQEVGKESHDVSVQNLEMDGHLKIIILNPAL